jgi:hypothetical protein
VASLKDLTTLLPTDRARAALLPPVRVLREATVVAARTTRHWELMLAGEDPTQRAREAEDERPSGPTGEGVVDVRDLGSDDLPVQGWPSMSLADAQASLSTCSPAELAALLAYEQAHGHRIAFEQMLQHRLERSGAVLADPLPD